MPMISDGSLARYIMRENLSSIGVTVSFQSVSFSCLYFAFHSYLYKLKVVPDIAILHIASYIPGIL